VVSETDNSKSLVKNDAESLLQYFQDHDIKQISLTSEGNLLAKYNTGKSEVINNNNKELQKVIELCQKNGLTVLSRQNLTNMINSNSTSLDKPKNNDKIITYSIVGLAIMALVRITILLVKPKRKKSKIK